MKIRYILLLTFAVFIDFLQAALGLVAFAVGASLQALTPAVGAAAGAAAGASACFNTSNGIVNAVVGAGKCAVGGGLAGAAASAFGLPLGVILGFVFDIMITLTFGSALIFLLVLLGMYSPVRVWGNYLLELIPGLDIIPAWTFMVILCILKDRAKTGKLKGKSSGVLAKMVLPTTTLGTAVAGIQAIQSAKTIAAVQSGAVSTGETQQMRANTRQNVRTELQNIDGIKPAAVPQQPQSRPYVQKTA